MKLKFKGSLSDFKKMLNEEARFIEGVGIVGKVKPWQTPKALTNLEKTLIGEDAGTWSKRKFKETQAKVLEEDTQEKLEAMRELEAEEMMYECKMSQECECEDCERENVWMDR